MWYTNSRDYRFTKNSINGLAIFFENHNYTLLVPNDVCTVHYPHLPMYDDDHKLRLLNRQMYPSHRIYE